MYENEDVNSKLVKNATEIFKETLPKELSDGGLLFTYTMQRAELLLLNSRFIHMIDDIRIKYADRIEDVKLDHPGVHLWHYVIAGPINFEWDDNVSDLMGKANLLPGWRRSINNYIINDIFVPPPSLQLRNRPNERGEDELCVVINDYVGSRDLAEVTSGIKVWRQFMQGARKGNRSQFKNLPYYIEMRKIREESVADYPGISAEMQRQHQDDGPVMDREFVRKTLNKFDKLIDRLVD